MPWIDYSPPPGEIPAHYEWLRIVPDETLLGNNIDKFTQRRKETGQLREQMLGYQKDCEKLKDYNTARYFREVAAQLQKEYRGYDCAINLIVNNDKSKISEQIASYVDRAFLEVQYATN